VRCNPYVALIAALVCAALGLAVTARFWIGGDATVGWIGLAIFVLAWPYSAPPFRLSARGLGELDSIVVVAVLSRPLHMRPSAGASTTHRS